MSTYDITVEQRDAVYASLSPEQRQFLSEGMLRGRRTAFAMTLARAKGAVIPNEATYEEIEHLLEDWVYTGYTDAGRISAEHSCLCGRPLRYQHRVQHKVTGQVLHFGIEHLKQHLGMDAKTVAAILKGFEVLDAERDELLSKVHSGWTLESQVAVPDGLKLPADIQAHLDLGLPLLDKQLARLKVKIRQLLEPLELQPRRRSAVRDAPAAETAAAPPPAEPEEEWQLAFDLFGGEAAPAAAAAAHPASSAAGAGPDRGANPLSLPERLKPVVNELLSEGVGSVRVMCEVLIQKHRGDGSRSSTGKPVNLYMQVCLYIDDELVRSGRCRLLERSNEDRVYAWAG
ncbi:hypothetical protein ACVNS2_13355 [Paenibacillus caseinilyticus]|uniref:DUF3895 domain-containing protein n=1 Tax=Paenibacillus mucilaginosus K02 TaxID=997761 RepID=R9ULE1_9BACL|nr:hypothetical protein [Paenibacillus mucilaginosus]AGN70664.1 hypothetical protein B2K_39200 [Paenibacillus mucilaginosus K02]